MAYVIKILSTKPANVAWFVQSGPMATSTLGNMRAFDLGSTGYLDSGMAMVDKNTVHNLVVFDTQANGDAWLAAKATQADWMVHDAYFTAQGITTVVTTYP